MNEKESILVNIKADQPLTVIWKRLICLCLKNIQIKTESHKNSFLVTISK